MKAIVMIAMPMISFARLAFQPLAVGSFRSSIRGARVSLAFGFAIHLTDSWVNEDRLIDLAAF